jgi:hypothetical protein
MLESLLEKVLNSILGTYVEKFKSDQIHLAIMSGTVDIEDIQIKKDLMAQLGYPFKLVHGTIGRIKLQIPWRNLLQAPVEVLIEGVKIELEPENEDQWVKHRVGKV